MAQFAAGPGSPRRGSALVLNGELGESLLAGNEEKTAALLVGAVGVLIMNIGNNGSWVRPRDNAL